MEDPEHGTVAGVRRGRSLAGSAVSVLVALTLTLSGCARRLDTAPAQAAAETWLSHLDRGDFGTCWDLASPTLRARQDQAAWVRSLEKSRAAMGPVSGRALAESHPGKPAEGQLPFVNLGFRVERAGKRTAGELMSVEQGADGIWRVLGYRAVGLADATDRAVQ